MIYQIDKLFDVACAIVTAQRIAEKVISAIRCTIGPKRSLWGLMRTSICFLTALWAYVLSAF